MTWTVTRSDGEVLGDLLPGDGQVGPRRQERFRLVLRRPGLDEEPGAEADGQHGDEQEGEPRVAARQSTLGGEQTGH